MINRHDSTKNYFPVPNVIYALGLSAGEIAVYGYLLSLENRKTYQCWPSYKTIGKAVHMSQNTVRKYVTALAEKQLVTVENTTIVTKADLKRNGNLRYTIRPIQEAVDYFHERQMVQLEADAERQRITKTLKENSRVAPQEPLCAALPETAGADAARL